MGGKVRGKTPGDPSDLWDYKPKMPDAQLKRLHEAAEFFDVPVEDYLYYIIADLILAELKARRWIKPWVRRQKMVTAVMEKIALLDYGKELLRNENQKPGPGSTDQPE